MTDQRTFAISLLAHEHTNEAIRRVLTLEDLTSALQTYQTRDSKSGGAWSPIVWDEDQRGPNSAESICALAYDLDYEHPEDPKSGPPIKQMAALGDALSTWQWHYIVHESYTAGRWRVVIPLAEDLEPNAYLEAWERVAKALGIRPDAKCRDLSRLFYLPACPPNETRASEAGGAVLLSIKHASPFSTQVVQPSTLKVNLESQVVKPSESGRDRFSPEKTTPKIFDLEAIRTCISRLPADTRTPLLEALNFRLLLKKGERENQLHKLVSALTTVLPSGAGWVEVEEIFGWVVDGMQEVEDKGRAHYMGCVRSSYDRSMERRVALEAQREAAADYFRPAPGSPQEWRSELLTVATKEGPKVKPCTANVDAILENDPVFVGHIRFNGLSRRVEITGGSLLEHSRETLDNNLSIWLQRSEYQMQMERGVVGNSILTVAKRHEYNPVSAYLEALKWDGTPRIAKALHNLCGVVGNDDYVESISRKFFISAAARALNPGCKVDTVLVLQGKQGTGKTSFVEELAMGWYTTVHTKVDDKDTRMQATGAWLVELSELASASKSTIESMRGFLTQRSDDIRIPYATTIENYPRRCVFIGTTNSDQPLVDQEGNRRYWVVATGRFDIRGLRAVRDQLWAEAVHCFREYRKEEAQGVPEKDMKFRWWLTPQEQEISDDENRVFQAENPMAYDIEQWAAKKDAGSLVTVMEIAKGALHFTSDRLAQDHSLLIRIGRTLKELKWTKLKRGTKTKRFWAYQIPLTVTEEMDT